MMPGSWAGVCARLVALLSVVMLLGALAPAGAWSAPHATNPGGPLRGWGDNARGQVEDRASSVITQVPAPMALPPDVIAAAGGEAHSLVLRANGTVWAWGSNDNGQLGDGTRTDRYAPVQVGGGLSGVVSVKAGFAHSVALKSDGTVWAWGANWYGQLGDGTIADRHTPVQVKWLT